jgi:4-hydroxy-tetrahydrodipicolinate reductase
MDRQNMPRGRRMSEDIVKIALPGAGGRMGQMISSLIAQSHDMQLSAAAERNGSPWVGKAVGDIVISDDEASLGIGSGGVIVDFTRPEATMALLDIAVGSKTAMVIGTTGLSDAQEAKLAKAAQHIPIIYCANTSVGVTLLSHLVRQVARQLSDSWDIEIVEAHHNQKVDAPSGTALALGHAAADGRGVALDDVRDSGRDGITGIRKEGDIGFAVLRGGDVAGEHSVVFYGEQESLSLTHKANSRTVFARGALRAARFAAAQAAPGLFTMDDVLEG